MPAGYKKKLADTDRLYYNTRYHGCGWVIGAEAGRTALLCLVVGAFGEVLEIYPERRESQCQTAGVDGYWASTGDGCPVS